MFTDGMKTSNTDNWSTPQYLFDDLNKEFHFTLDPCANESNHKCEKYFDKETDGLSQSWGGYRVFCNPPYGRAIAKWVEKCASEAEKENTLVVGLLPARTDTRWFHDYVLGKSEIRFIKGRLRFGEGLDNAPFPSMVVVWGADNEIMAKGIKR